MSTVLTLALDSASQTHFESLRRQFYPPVLNRIPAHVSLFHQLPRDDSIAHVLHEQAARTGLFSVRVTGVRSLGRGVAYTLASAELASLHEKLADIFADYLIPQDRQRFSPHIVVQNKSDPAQAKALLSELQASFVPREMAAVGLLWWEYLGGPWRLIREFRFSEG